MENVNNQNKIFSDIKFSSGKTVITKSALKCLPQIEIDAALYRHFTNDWGDCCEEDWNTNNEALKNGGRLLSVYKSKADIKFGIITEWDRSVTTVLLPED